MGFRKINIAFILSAISIGIAGCSTSNTGSGIDTALSVAPPTTAPAPLPQLQPLDPINTASAAPKPAPVLSNNGPVFAAVKPEIGYQNAPLNSKTYLINGLASKVGSIARGFEDLSKKIPNSRTYNYVTFIESMTIIRSGIIRDMKAEYARDPNIQLNLVGISYGANIVTQIAAKMNSAGIPVNYVATLDGPAMVPIRKNVKTHDAFTCTKRCFGNLSRLGPRNQKTEYSTFTYPTTHVGLSEYGLLHNRVVEQIESSRYPNVPPLLNLDDQLVSAAQ